MVNIIPFDNKRANIKSIFVAPDVYLIGDVRLEGKTSVWFGSILKGDTEPVFIGERTQILEQVYVENSKIGKNCLISHKAIVHQSSIGNNVLVGMNSGIYNEARIGNNCIIGAGTLVLPKNKIPDNSVVIGNPSRVLRTTKEEDLNYINSSVEIVISKAFKIEKES